MTIDLQACRETEVHVQTNVNFFPTTIPVNHHQLRHLIALPESNQIYFVNGKDVYCVNSSLGSRTHIAELPFKPKCIAAGSGWFCAGGCPQGRFAAFRLPSQRSDGTPQVPSTRSISSQVRIERLGTEIINSISIHTLPREDASREVVVVLTNNDCSVKIYSLSRDMELKIEDFPFPMNHASVSPDGQMMMIVGDQEYVYFYECVDEIQSWTKRKSTREAGDHAQWELLRVCALHKPLHSKHSGYFTTAWSPSGNLCATASEHGYITVFDTEAIGTCLNVSDAIVAVIESSRPCTTAGAIRCIQFAPKPWDLLLWTEHFGTFCVADLRSGLRTRQTIRLDPQGENVRKIQLTDTYSTLENSPFEGFDPDIDYLTSAERSTEGVANTTDFLRASVERRRLQRQAEVFGPQDDQGLTAQEREILDGLRTTRQREDALREGHSRPQRSDQSASVDNRASADNREQVRDHTVTRANEIQGPHSSALAHQDSVLLASLRDYIRDRSSWGDLRRHERLLSVRPPDSATSNSSRASAGTSSSATSVPTNTTTSADAWRTIESAMQRATNTSSNREDPEAGSTGVSQSSLPATAVTHTRNLAEAERWLRDWTNSRGTTGEPRPRRERMRETLRNNEESRGLLRRVANDSPTGSSGWRTVMGHDDADPASGPGTTGIAISECGRTVYIGITEGVFEFKLNYDERKTWSAFEPR